MGEPPTSPTSVNNLSIRHALAVRAGRIMLARRRHPLALLLRHECSTFEADLTFCTNPSVSKAGGGGGGLRGGREQVCPTKRRHGRSHQGRWKPVVNQVVRLADGLAAGGTGFLRKQSSAI